MTAFIYHFYNSSTCSDVELHKEAPIIYSIATLRAVNPFVKIYVLDRTPGLTIWGPWPSVLNFEVIVTEGYFDKIHHASNFKSGDDYRYIAEKVFDIAEFVEKIPESHIIYCDTDIFWLKNPLPLLQWDKFCFSKYLNLIPGQPEFNSGFYYFDKNNRDQVCFFCLWQHYLLKGLIDRFFEDTIKKEAVYSCVSDESSLIYTAIHAPKHLFDTTLIVRNVRQKEDLENITESGIHCIWLHEPDKRKFCIEHKLLAPLVRAVNRNPSFL